MATPKVAVKRKAGRPRLPDARRRRWLGTSVTPAERAFLERIGGGSASRGLRALVERAVADAARIDRDA